MPILKEIQIKTEIHQQFFNARDKFLRLKNDFYDMIESYDIKPDGITLKMNTLNMQDPANLNKIA